MRPALALALACFLAACLAPVPEEPQAWGFSGLHDGNDQEPQVSGFAGPVSVIQAWANWTLANHSAGTPLDVEIRLGTVQEMAPRHATPDFGNYTFAYSEVVRGAAPLQMQVSVPANASTPYVGIVIRSIPPTPTPEPYMPPVLLMTVNGTALLTQRPT